MKHIKMIITLTGLLAIAMSSTAALLTFDNGDPANSNLSSALNWNTDTVPTAADDLIIPTGFTALGNLGGRTGTQANSVLIQGAVDGGNWALVVMTIDGGSITLGGGGGAFGGAGDADLINGGIMTFKAKTATEVVAQYADDITIAGVLSIFGSDPLVIESGDNAYIVENAASGADNVTVYAIPEPATLGMLAVFGGCLVFLRRRSRA